MYIVELSNKIANKINAKHRHWNGCREFDDIRSLNRHHMMACLKLYWSKKIWQILGEKSGLYIYMDRKTLEEWITKVSLNDFPELTIENIKKIFKEYFSMIKVMTESSVLDLQDCFEFICQYPDKIIIKDLVYEDPLTTVSGDGYFKKKSEKEYIDNRGISKIYKLLKVCCILDGDINSLKEECDIKNDLNKIYKAGMNEWKCKYFNIYIEQKIGFLYITNKVILKKITSTIENKVLGMFGDYGYENIIISDDEEECYKFENEVP
jgi:hypothetical protein